MSKHFLAALFAAVAILCVACENSTVTKKSDADPFTQDNEPNDEATIADDLFTEEDPDPAQDTDNAASDIERPDGDTLEAICIEHEDCSEGLFCDREPGLCGGPGTCAPMPDACDENYEPVCGCDGKTHANTCNAAAAGTNILHAGPCGSMIPCTLNKQCTETEYCAKPIGACAEGADGRCDLMPVDCSLLSELFVVCGCDGKSYEHPCFAHAKGINLDHTGACEGENICLHNDECGEKEFCRKSEGVCANGSGLCELRPEACPFALGTEVCGCDGNDYPDECNAHVAGVNVAFAGRCADAVPKSSLNYGFRNAQTPPVTAHVFLAFSIGDTVEYFEATIVEKINTNPTSIILRVTYGNILTPAPGDESVLVQLSLPRTAEVPYTVKLDGINNYVRWMDAMGNAKGNFFGSISITHYETDNDFPNYTVTELDFFGDDLKPE